MRLSTGRLLTLTAALLLWEYAAANGTNQNLFLILFTISSGYYYYILLLFSLFVINDPQTVIDRLRIEMLVFLFLSTRSL